MIGNDFAAILLGNKLRRFLSSSDAVRADQRQPCALCCVGQCYLPPDAASSPVINATRPSSFFRSTIQPPPESL